MRALPSRSLHLRWFIACILVLVALPAAAQERPRFDLEVERSGVERLVLELAPVAIETSVEGADEAAVELARRLITDLVYSGLFSFRGPLPDGIPSPRYAPDAWTAEEEREPIATLHLTLSGIRGDEMVWAARLLEYKRRTQLLGKRYLVDLENSSRKIHHLADAIVRKLTGDDGIAQTRILFSRKVGESREIFLVDYDGENMRQITSNGSLNLLPRWSPDNSNICYTSYWDGRQRLLVLNGKTGESRKVTDFAGLNYGASWAPNGEELVVTLTRDGGPEVYRLGLDGKIRARLTFGTSIDCSPVFDPTGNQIAYTSDRTGVPQIFRMSRDGTDRMRLTWEGSYNDGATWSPKGDRIAYVSRRSGRFQIFAIDADGSNLTPVTLPSDGSNEDCSWAPDGRHLVLSSDRDGTRRLWIIDVDSGWARPLTYGEVDDNGAHWSGPTR